MKTARILIIVLFVSLGMGAYGGGFSRTRHKAGVLTMISYNPTPHNIKNYNCKKAQISGLCRTFVQEGGYDSQRLYSILDITDPEVEYVAMILDELEGGRERLPRIGTLLLASAVSFAYTSPSADGMRAAVHAGRLGGIDPDCDGVSRAVYSIIIYAVEGVLDDKDELLKVAAINAESEKVAYAIRALRMSEWRKLPDESSLLGRFTRALFLWRRSKNFSDAVNLGNRKLLYPESRAFLAVLAACWTDLPYLPENFVWKALMDRDIRDICCDLYGLANEGILARVPENLVYGQVSENMDYSKEKTMVNGEEVIGVASGQSPENTVNIASPALPAQPRSIPAPVIKTTYSASPALRQDQNLPPSSDELIQAEDSPLSPIKPLAPLSGNDYPYPQTEENQNEVSTVSPDDFFWGAFFAD